MRKPIAESFSGMPTDVAEAMSEFYYEPERFASYVVPGKNFSSFDDQGSFPPVPSYVCGQAIVYNSGSINDRNPPVRRQTILYPSDNPDRSPTATTEHMLTAYRFVGALQEIYNRATDLTDIDGPVGEGAAADAEIDGMVKQIQHEEKIRTFGAFLLMQNKETGDHYAGMQISRRLRDEIPLEVRELFIDELRQGTSPESSVLNRDILQAGDASRMIGYVIASRYFPSVTEVQGLLPRQAESADQRMGLDRDTRKKLRKKHKKIANSNFSDVIDMHRQAVRLRKNDQQESS